jgi:hypothetical protein
MEMDLKGVIEGVILKFNQNRTGTKPAIFARVPPDLPHIVWQSSDLESFIRSFLYNALLVNNPEMPIRIVVQERRRLADLEGFVGISPLYWIQLRVQRHGPGLFDLLAKETLAEFGYRCEEWVGVEGSEAQLGIFSHGEKDRAKIVFCVDVAGHAWKCDFLIPVSDRLLLPSSSFSRKKH